MAGAVAIGVYHGGDTEDVGLRDRSSQEVDKRILDARVRYTGGGKKQFYLTSPNHTIEPCNNA